jgi:hypothetical protein
MIEPVLIKTSSFGSTLELRIKAPVWVVVGNIKGHKRGGVDPQKRYSGTRVFSPKTKVYLGQYYAGMGLSSHVIGLSRNRRSLANCVIDIEMLENIRPKLEYSVHRLKALQELESMFFLSEAEAQAHANWVLSSIEHNLARAQT